MYRIAYYIAVCLCLLVASGSWALVLPENRADMMFHYYNGNDVEVSGPALLIREDILDTYSASVSYYVDNVSSASVDVITTASPFKDVRKQSSVGLDYLYKDSIVALSYTQSKENDYDANTLDMGVTHEAFGGMTTINLGYSLGSDTVRKVTDPTFSDSVDRNNYRVSLSQVLSPRFLTNFAYEAVAEDGYLNNPYRTVRISGVPIRGETYPRTRTSHAVSMKGVYMLSRAAKASMYMSYRYFFDTWDISAQTFTLGLSWRLSQGMIVDGRFRYYDQTAASFYSDNFQREFNYMARDKELSTFRDNSLGLKISMDVKKPFKFMDRFSFNASYDIIFFAYEDFKDYTINPNGEKFKFDAQVIQLYFSAWY